MRENRPWWKRWVSRGWRLFYWTMFGGSATMAFAVVIAWGFMWRLPDLAADRGVQSFDVALRALEWGTDHPADPFYLLGANPTVAAGVLEVVEVSKNGIKSDFSANEYLVDRVGPYEYRHTLKGPSRTLTLASTTPHLVVPRAELERAERNVARVYDDPTQLGGWAKGLIWLAWARTNSRTRVEVKDIPQPLEGDAPEQAWVVWQVLAAGQPTAERDLPRLAELVASAYHDEAERRRAIAWAQSLYGRWKQTHAAFHQLTNTLSSTDPEVVAVALPPEGNVTFAWMLYQHVGLTPESRKAVVERYRSYFPAKKWEMVRAYGAGLRKEREALGEPLPPGGEEVDWLCAVERFTGRDGYGQKCRDALTDSFSARFLDMLSLAMRTGYPNDDVFYVLGSGDRMELFSSSSELWRGVLYTAMVLWGLRLMVFRILGEWILGLRDNATYVEYRTGRGHRDVVSLFIGYVAVPLIAWGIAIATLPTTIEMLMPSPLHLFAGVFVSVLLGGTFILTITRLIAVLMIWRGIDVHAVWWDEIVGLSLGGLILLHFGNGPLTIATFIAFDLAPGVVAHFRRAGSIGRE